MIIKYAKSLKKGDVIGVTATSDGANLEKLDKAICNLEKKGYAILETKNVRQSKNLVSSDGKTRAEQWYQLYQDVRVKHIIAASGGEFLMDMIPYLHAKKEQIKKQEEVKMTQGYSDTSLLNFYLTTNYNIATLHANNFGSYAMKDWYVSIKQTLDFLEGDKEKELVQYNFAKYQKEEPENEEDGFYLTEDVKYQLFGSKDEAVSFEGRLIGRMY